MPPDDARPSASSRSPNLPLDGSPMRITRRRFLTATGLVGVGLIAEASMGQRVGREQLVPWCGRDLNQAGALQRAQLDPDEAGPVIEFEKQIPKIDPARLAKFVDPLPIPAALVPVASAPDPERRGATVPMYRVEMVQFFDRVHRDLKPVRLWGYDGRSPGPTIEARKGRPLFIEWRNRLPMKHLLPIDPSLHGAERSHPAVRAVVHAHGAHVAPSSDGYPEAWLAPGQSAIYHYPNRQDAATLWYHDHALGITRLNVYAGLYGMFIIRDEHEEALGLPSGTREIPITICDRAFNLSSQLEYMRFHSLPYARWAPEFHGNAVLVNGRLFPYLEVEPCRYRIRIANVANGTFFRISLGGGSFFQIGSDQGLLAEPVELDAVTLAPAERADLVVDFARYKGKAVSLMAGDTEAMQFRVGAAEVRDRTSVPSKLRTIARLPESDAVRTRILTLDEYLSPRGATMMTLLNGARWSAPVTEDPVIDTTEIWSLVNLTRDTHPIHLHLVRFQVLDRRPFDITAYRKNRKLIFTGPAEVPEPNLRGWKDTVCVPAGMVVRIIMRFEGFTGRYVWHCHVLEHEDNEMMRPFDVKPG